jgi:hypothetical protein
LRGREGRWAVSSHQAKDIDEAIAIMADWPSARIGSIEVRPIEDGLKMDAATARPGLAAIQRQEHNPLRSARKEAP